jgi:hypothetical protein
MRNARIITALVVGISFLAASSSEAASRRINAGHQKSWGMAGVSLEQYWTDSAECAHMAAETDLTGTAPADALVVASRRIDNAFNYDDVAMALRLAAPEHQWKRAAEIMEAVLEGCLTERGYVKFELTDGQYRQLRMFDVGTLERRQYLHSLASDAAILEAQGVRPEA